MNKMTRTQEIVNAPAYATSEAAHFLHLPAATVRAWSFGQRYKSKPSANWKRFEAVIRAADTTAAYLSFVNLVELHVLGAIRRIHSVPLPKVRLALDYVTRHMKSDHPLADQDFQTDGLSLFVEKFGQLINASQGGQVAIRPVIEAHLRRIERNSAGIPIRLYPFSRRADVEQPSVIVIDPTLAFGKPVIRDTGIPTSILAERFDAGESLESLASDYDKPLSEIEEALRYERQAA